MPIVEKRVPIELGGVKRSMVFDGNTMCAYEEATGKFFLDTVATLYDVLRSNVKPAKPTPDGTEEAPAADLKNAVIADERKAGAEIMRKLSMTTLRALLWASLHTYDQDGEPRWPLTITQVGRQLTIEHVAPIFLAFINGQVRNSPTPEEMGESRSPQPEAGPSGESDAPTIGGGLSIASLEDALG
jgi:hypothetical protein